MNLDPTAENFDPLAWLYAMCEMTSEDCSARIARVIAELESLQQRVERPSAIPCTCQDWHSNEVLGWDNRYCDDYLLDTLW
jgi:hypothetical protein